MVRIIGKKIIYYQEVDSTNQEAKRQIKAGLGEGGVVVADYQTKGKGKPGRNWFSPPGMGVYLSAVIKPFRNPSDLAPLTLLGAKSVASAIKKISGLEPTIKLPNDVLLNHKKVSGILVERMSSGHVILGIGVNLNHPPGSFPHHLRETATSLKIESKKGYQVKEFVKVLVSELDREYLAYLRRI